MMSRSKIRALIFEGEALLNLGQLTEARGVFKVAAHKPGLVACGEKFLAKGWPTEALRAFEATGEPTAQQLVACAEMLLAGGRVTEACQAFEAAAHKPGLVACGEKFLEMGFPTKALRAFETTGEPTAQ